MTGTTYVADVTAREQRPVLFPDAVVEMEGLGFSVLGRFGTVAGASRRDRIFTRPERERLAAWRERPAYPVLVADDGSAFASVDSYGDARVLLLRTELTDGSLVETVGVDREGMLRPRGAIDPFAVFTNVETSDRDVLMLPGTDLARVVAGHREHVRVVASRRGSLAVVHAARDHALRIWLRANAHAELTARRSDLLSTALGCAVIVAVGASALLGAAAATVAVAALVGMVLWVAVLALAARSRLVRRSYRGN